jgi:uncharacterized phage-associated protein
MKKAGVLTVLLCTSVALSACSSDNDGLELGSRDDIIIMKNGVPVDVSASTKTAMSAEAPAAPQEIMMEKATAEATDEVTEAQAEMVEMAPDVSEEVAKKTASVESQTEVVETVVSTEAVTPEDIQARMAQVETAKKMAEMEKPVVSEDHAVTDMEPVKEVVMAETKAKAEQEIKKSPVVETTTQEAKKITEDVVSSVEPVMEKTEAPSAPAPAPMQEKAPEMIEGCMKKVLIPSTPGNVTPVPVFEQRRVVCQKDITPSLVAIVQRALINQGYSIGAPDGRLGNKTFNALEDYQRKNGLGIGGFTVETLESLNIRK